jgi:calcium-translocating P-type ATPase
MHITRLSQQAALESLRSAPAGLSAEEAARRLAEYGPNRIESVAREPIGRLVARQLTHFFAVLLLIAAALAFLAEAEAPGQGMGVLGAAIIGVVLLNGAFSGWQEYRAERAIEALRAMLPHRALVRRRGAAMEIETAAVVPGDILLLSEGDDVPADCRLLEAHGLRANLATVTGESVPRARDAGAGAEDDLLKSRNVLLAGTSVVAGSAVALVFATGMGTEFGRIARLTQSVASPASPLQREIARLSRLIAVLAALLGVVFFLVGQAMGLGFWANLLFAIGIIVANVPEGLLPTVTLALAMATQRMAKRNALIRHLPAAETLGAASVIVTDKTGTLTENRMRAAAAWFPCGGPGLDRMSALDAAARAPFFDAARHCNSVKQGGRALLGDPTEIALVEMAGRINGHDPLLPPRDEIAFDSDRRRMSTIHDRPGGRILYCKGALETVLPLCAQAMQPSPLDVSRWHTSPLTDELRAATVRAEEDMARRGLRVLALAYRVLPADAGAAGSEHDLVLAGLVGLHDPARPEVPAAIATCRRAGIRVVMVTGDHPHTALAVARDIGLGEPACMTGDALARLSDTQLQMALNERDVLFARVTAEQKLRIVETFQRKGHVVAATGDGVNDAPALRRADIGIAMGRVGTDVARGAADMVLLDDNFASIVAAIEEGRAVFQNTRKFLTYILTSNVPEIVPYLAFVLFRIPLPLTIIQILAVDLGTDMVPALALGAERPAADTMSRPPRPRSERLLTWRLLARAYLWLGPLQAAAAMAAFFFVLGVAGWTYGTPLDASDPVYRQATTACLAAIVLMQVANVFICRDERASAFAAGPANVLIHGGIAFELALLAAIVYAPSCQALFGTAALPAAVWLFIVPFALSMLALEEARKGAVRRRARQAAQGLAIDMDQTPPGAARLR